MSKRLLKPYFEQVDMTACKCRIYRTVGNDNIHYFDQHMRLTIQPLCLLLVHLAASRPLSSGG